MKKTLVIFFVMVFIVTLTSCSKKSSDLKCSECNKELIKGATYCAYCGAENKTNALISENSSTIEKDSLEENTLIDEDILLDEEADEFAENVSNKNVVGEFDEEAVKKQLSVQKYSYESEYDNYLFLEVANNSKYDISIYIDAKFYDANKKLIGAKSVSESVFQQGTKTLLYFYPDEEYSSFEYEISVEELSDFYECVVKDLSYESVKAKNKEIVSVTNNGKKEAENVEGNMLFFNGNKIVGYERTYFSDHDGSIKSGKTITEEMECYENYTSYKFYLSGYNWNW